ncbi:MAG: hypothetical protein GEV09_05840 [Pseudonocardiaceae bacterium]|nr:hypothetical protein [Pseudonocardiaceae bacterium]
MPKSTTCQLVEGCDRTAMVHCITRSGVFTGCQEHVNRATARRRDYLDVDAYGPDPLLDRPGRDWLTDVIVEHLEHHHGQAPVAVEYAVVYQTLRDDGGGFCGAITPIEQGATVTRGLLLDTAADTGERIEGGARDE